MAPIKKKKKKAKKKKVAKKKTVWAKDAPKEPKKKVWKRPPPKQQTIFALDAVHIPHDMYDNCMDIDDEFPLHYATGIVRIEEDDRSNPFVVWLEKKNLIVWLEDQDHVHLAVWGT